MEDEKEKNSGFLGEIVRTSAIFSVTKAILNNTSVGKSKYGALATILTAGTTSLLTNDSNDDNADLKTLGAMIVGGAVGLSSKRIINAKGYELTKFIQGADKMENSIRGGLLESIQKFSEWKRGNSVLSIFDDPNSAGEFANIFDSSVNSKAFHEFYSGTNAHDYKKLYFANNKINNEDASYIINRIKVDEGGHSFFKNVLSSYTKDGDFDVKTLTNDKTIFGQFKKILDSKNETGSYYSGLLKRNGSNYNTFEDFLKDQGSSADRDFLMDQFSQFAQKGGIFSDGKDKTVVTLSDLLQQKNGSDFIDTLSKNFKIEADEVESLFGNTIIKGLKKNKNGMIFDESTMNAKTFGVDLLSNVEELVRPVFSFLPGESVRNFSLLPFKMSGFANTTKNSAFQILTAGKNSETINSSILFRRQQIINETGEIANFKNRYTGDWTKKKKDLLDQLDTLKIQNDYKLNSKDEMLFPGISDEVLSGKSSVKFVFGSNGDIDSFKVINKGNNVFIDETGSLFFKNKKTAWEKKAGKYNFSYHGLDKDNQARYMGSYVTKNLHDAGITEDKYYESNIYERTKEIASLAKSSFNKKKGEIFKREIDDFLVEVKRLKDDAVSKNDVSKLRLFRDAEKVSLHGFGIRGNAVYNNNNWSSASKNLKNFESSIKENLIRKLISNGAIDDIDSLSKNKFFNKHYIENTYFKSVFDSRNPTIVRKFGSLAEDSSQGIVRKVGNNFIKPSASKDDRLVSYTNDLFVKDAIGTTAGSYMSGFVQKFQDSLNIIGLNNKNFNKLGQLVESASQKSKNQQIKNVGKTINNFLSDTLYIDPNKDTFNAANHFTQLMMKRVLPVLGLVYGAKALEGVTDLATPDELHESGIGGATAKAIAGLRIGFQAILDTTGIRGAANWMVEKGLDPFITALELNLSADELYERHMNGKEIAIKRNRFWFGSNRTPFSGTESMEYRKSLLYRLQHRDSGIYDSKMERFIREDFIVSKLATRMMPEAFSGVEILDPYLEEKRALEKGAPMAKSEQLFDDVPVFGEALSATLGEFIKPTKYYDGTAIDPLTGLRAFEKGFEDIKTMAGYQGYFIGAASNFLFNSKNTSEFLRDQFDIDVREHESIDKVTNATQNFYDLELGGMFGLTEPIRRIFTNNSAETKNPYSYSGTDWLSEAIATKKINTKTNAEYLMDTSMNAEGNESELEKLKLLAINAPRSYQYENLKNQIYGSYKNGQLSIKDSVDYFRAISIANDLNDRNDIAKDKNFVADARIRASSVSIDSVVSGNEFISGGKRFKLSGLETDFSKLTEKMDETSALKLTNSLQQYLSNSGSLNVLFNENKRAKLDDSGEYYEVYAPELDNLFGGLKNDSYLRTMSAEGSVLGKGMEFMFQNIRSFSGPAPIMNLIGKRDTVAQWYRESEQIPSFRNWENPYESFVAPIYDLASNPANVLLLANLGNSSSIFNGLDRVFAPTMVTPLLGVGALKAATNGRLPENYAKEDQIQMTLEKTKRDYGQASIFTNTASTNWFDIKSSLTYDESMAFNDLINLNSSSDLRKVEEYASDRFKRIIDVSEQKLNNFQNNSYSKSDFVASKDRLTDDYFYNLAKAKIDSGLELNGFEKEKIKNYNFDQSYKTNISVETLRNRYFKGKIKSRVTSTIYTGTNENKKY